MIYSPGLGPRGLYRGLGISLLEITPYTISFGGYEWLKGLSPPPADGAAGVPTQPPCPRIRNVYMTDHPPRCRRAGADEPALVWVWRRLGCGWVAGLSGSLACYPMDTVKRRMMVAELAADGRR
jgi:hypothetical protein